MNNIIILNQREKELFKLFVMLYFVYLFFMYRKEKELYVNFEFFLVVLFYSVMSIVILKDFVCMLQN